MSLKQRVRYRFDNLMARGVGAQILLLAVFTVVIVLITVVLLLVLGVAPKAEGGETESAGLLAWKSLMHTMDAGTLGGDNGSWTYLFVFLFATIGGLFVVSALIGVLNQGFTVPRYDDKKLSTSTMILASKMRSTNERDVGGMFVIGNAKVIPNLSGVYKQGQEVGVYMQVYNAGVDQTTLRPAVDVEYVLVKGGKEVFRQPEDWTGLSDSGQRLTLARLLPTDGMTPGDYELKILTKDRVGGQVIENKGKFTITQ